MANKKNIKKTNTKHYVVLGAIIFFIVLFASLLIFSNHKHYYECEQFVDGQGIVSSSPTTNRLKNYEFYRLYLNEDGTFSLKYRLAETKDEREETGTYKYKNKKTELVLTYKNPTQEMDETCTYKVDGDYLVRDETLEIIINEIVYYYTVNQKFKFK